jgi:hypothetical protein
MAQLTIYLDDRVLALVKAATKTTGMSQSQWVAEAIRRRVNTEWPAAVVALAGAWPDFPTAEEIRKRQGNDSARERF